MADWVDISHNYQWPHIPDPPLLDNSRLAMMFYYQDHPNNNSEPKTGLQQEVRDNVYNRYAYGAAAEDIAMGESVMWMRNAMERSDPLPFLAAGAAVMLTPVVDPETTIGQGIVAGYVAGVLVNYAILKGKDMVATKKMNQAKA